MKGQTNSFAKPAAKSLRKTLTDAEQKLWYRLRGNQLGFKFRRQHPFEKYVLDFVCMERRLIIEVDGSQHMDQQAYDDIRSRQLEAAGFTVMRF